MAKAPKLQSAHFVFATFHDGTGTGDGEGWGLRASDAYVAAVGVLFVQYTLLGYDASAHLCEETRKAVRDAPLALLCSIAASAAFGFFLLVALLFSIQDFEKVRTARQPVLHILIDACGKGGGLVLMVLIMLCVWHCGLFSLVRISHDGLLSRDPSLNDERPRKLTSNADVKFSHDVRLCPRRRHSSPPAPHRPRLPLPYPHRRLRRHLLLSPRPSFPWFRSRSQWYHLDRYKRSLYLIRYPHRNGPCLAPELQAWAFQPSVWFKADRGRCLPLDLIHYHHLLPSNPRSGHQSNFQLHACCPRCCRYLRVWLMVPLGPALVHRALSPSLQDLYPAAGFLGRGDGV